MQENVGDTRIRGLMDKTIATVDELYELYHEPLARRIAFLAHGNHEQVEELEQEIWLKVTRYFPKLRHKDNMYGWLYSIANSVFFSACRKQQSAWGRLLQLSYDDPDNDIDLSDSRHNPDRAYADCELMRQALGNIGAKYRQLLIDHFIEGKETTNIRQVYEARRYLHAAYKRLLRKVEVAA